MTKKKPVAVLAAGAVVLRERKGLRTVLMVHRPAYDDWTLPKGKPNPDEDLPAAAVREVLEETAVRVRLGPSLGTQSYLVAKGVKRVHWWVGHHQGHDRRKPDKEVDKVAWVDVREARTRLTYADELEVLDKALAMMPTSTLIIVRHAKAMARRHWSGKDWKRPITARGRKQSLHLIPLLSAFGVGALASSSSTRCVQTLQPYSQATGLPVRPFTEISEEYHERAPGDVSDVMQACVGLALSGDAGAVAVCGHRPVLPDMKTAVGAPATPMQVAECLVMHLGDDGQIVAHETHRSRL